MKEKIPQKDEGKMSKRDFIKRAALTTLGIGAFGIGVYKAKEIFDKKPTQDDKRLFKQDKSVTSQQARVEMQPPWLTIDDSFSAEQKQTISKAVSDWDAMYHCNRRISIVPFTGTEITLPDESIISVLEEAFPGLIKIDLRQDAQVMRNTILHAMSHAFQNDKPTLLTKKFSFYDASAYAYHGASILVLSDNGEETAFRKMEEGICERNASFFKNYTVTDPRYFALGKLARKHFPQGSQVVEFMRNNDVLGIVGLVLNKPKEKVAEEDVIKVSSIYLEAYMSAK